MRGFARFYLVRNYALHAVRAWHAHKHERKIVTVVSGAALICCVQVDDWERPSTGMTVSRYVLSAEKPAALLIPGGFANGSMNLAAETTICYFSDVTIEDAPADDIRFPARHWDPWHVEER